MIGSFVNVVAYRLPIGKSFIGGKSFCPRCSVSLKWHDLIPVLSFILLKRRCYGCKAKISWQYPLVEIYSGLVFLLSFWFFANFGLVNWLFTVFILELLVILALIDIKHLILPDSVLLTLLGAAVVYWIWQRFTGGDRLFDLFSSDSILSALFFLSVFSLLWFFSKGKLIGLGDVKLLGLVGLIFGFVNSIIIIYGAVFGGTIVGLIMLAFKKGNLKTKLPLGAFISLSATVFIFVGPYILKETTNIFRLIRYLTV